MEEFLQIMTELARKTRTVIDTRTPQTEPHKNRKVAFGSTVQAMCLNTTDLEGMALVPGIPYQP